MKYAAIIAVILWVCVGIRFFSHEGTPTTKAPEPTNKVCLEGVLYHKFSMGHASHLAPVYDKVTKQVVLCDD